MVTPSPQKQTITSNGHAPRQHERPLEDPHAVVKTTRVDHLTAPSEPSKRQETAVGRHRRPDLTDRRQHVMTHDLISTWTDPHTIATKTEDDRCQATTKKCLGAPLRISKTNETLAGTPLRVRRLVFVFGGSPCDLSPPMRPALATHVAPHWRPWLRLLVGPL